ncbi:MAG TPA: hypothetical protein DDZ89_20070 [Clostridiales bacterium]|nr:hypothetical protein [Clostridiales bacterium]
MEIIEEVNKILEEKMNTIIDIEYIPVSMFNKGEILTKLYSNNHVDVIDYMPQNLEAYIEDLNIADLTDILPTYYPELFEPGINLSNIYTDGRIYSFPVITASAYQDRYCLLIDREFYESAGEPAVNTIYDVIDLYDYGVEHENKEGVRFLDEKANRYFFCPFTYFTEIYFQSSGYTLLSNSYFYAEKDDEIIDLFETDVPEDCYSSLAYMYSKNAINEGFSFYGQWPPDPRSKVPGLSMALIMNDETSFFPNTIRDYSEFNRLYKVMFIGDHEIYPNRYAIRRFIICGNGNADRGVIALRYMVEDPDLNRLLTYGIEDKHYKFVDGCIESTMNEEGFIVHKWMPTIVNKKHFVPLVFSPEGSEKYIRDLYYGQPKQVIPGVANSKLSSTINRKKDDIEMDEAMLERAEIYGEGKTYSKLLSRGITYNEITSKLDKEEQRKLLDRIKEDVDELKRLQ